MKEPGHAKFVVVFHCHHAASKVLESWATIEVPIQRLKSAGKARDNVTEKIVGMITCAQAMLCVSPVLYFYAGYR